METLKSDNYNNLEKELNVLIENEMRYELLQVWESKLEFAASISGLIEGIGM